MCHRLKGLFHGPTNHDDETEKMADEWKLTKTIDRCEGITKVADECLWSFQCTVVTDILVADQLPFFIVFYKTCRPPELHLSPFVVAYMAPRPSDEFPLIGGRFSLIWSACGMGPLSPLT